MQLYNYVKTYCAPTEEPDVIKAQLSLALNSLVEQNLIRNLQNVTGMRGTYELLPAGLLAAGHALRLSDEDIVFLKGVGATKLKK